MESNINYRPILIFTPGQMGGAEKVVITGTHALHELNLCPHLIIIKESRIPSFADNFIKEFSPQIEISVIESTHSIDFSLSQKINEILKKEKKKLIIHTHGFKALIYSQLINAKHIHVHTHHGNTSHNFKMKIYEWIADLAMKKCQHVVAVSEEMKKSLLTHLAPYKKISTIQNMLSFQNASELRKRKKSRLQNTLIHLIYIGRISPEKGLLPFLHNLNSYPNKEHFKLSVLGDGEEKNQAINFVKNSQLERAVTFFGHVYNPSDYLSEADALILPSLREGLPMTLLEALASGVPVLANDVGAIKNLISSHQNGLVVPNNTESYWHKAFRSLSEEIESWQMYTLEHASEVEENYSAQKWGLKTKELYDLLILSNENESD